MRTEQIEAVRAACIKATPEIVELKFGCDIRFALTDGGGSLATVLFSYDGDYVTASYAKFHENKAGTVSRHLNKIEIIGRPIRLADVLLAMGKPVKYMTPSGLIGTIHKDVVRVISLWNLRTDGLEQQSDQTIAFISSLLTV
ncbi:hypothetical protein ACVWWI_006354 [Bradyrhizobium sp. USDA 3686]|uniref:hypothetical protein n=1 Tax=Bradyrhizobium canariense TaxID=255045 RepID=UPI00195B0592|nr:hypothetical protein [Bradyrhizobium canariense]MBM7488095.1 hypothetical protein [Bradyrhizobium canariense]